MAKNQPPTCQPGSTRFEFRVWGSHPKAAKRLAKLALTETFEVVDDCYLIVDDPMWNAKIRGNKLKVKQLVAEQKGFERWVSSKHRSGETAPTPFDVLFAGVDIDRLTTRGMDALHEVLANLDPEVGIRAVFVTKRRRRFEIGQLPGQIRAEVTEIELVESGEILHTLAIEGDGLDALVALRRELGLRKAENTPVHQVIEAETGP